MTFGLNLDCLGKDYQDEVVATRAQMEGYARAVGDLNEHYVDLEREGGIVAHPVFAVRLLSGLMPRVLGDPELRCNMRKLVHGEQTFTYLQPLRPGDRVKIEGAIIDIEDKHNGQILRIEQRLLVDGELAVRGLSAAFIRGSGPLPPPPPRPKILPRRFRPPGTKVSHAAATEVGEDQGRRYAQASGDPNPIHLDPEVAAKAGLPGVILQGTCTLAFAARAVVHVLGGDPARLRYLSARFAKPVMIPDRVTVEIWEPEPGVLRYEAHNRAGETVLSHGVAETHQEEA